MKGGAAIRLSYTTPASLVRRKAFNTHASHRHTAAHSASSVTSARIARAASPIRCSPLPFSSSVIQMKRALGDGAAAPAITAPASCFERVCSVVGHVYSELRHGREGSVASSIPQLEAVNADLFAMAVCSKDGEIFSVGNDTVPFTLQSAVFPALYTNAIQLCGRPEVSKYMGHEPSGGRFDAFVLNDKQQPHNPFVKAGGIMSTALVKRHLQKQVDAYNSIERLITLLTGGAAPVAFDNTVFLSECGRSARGLALAHFIADNTPFLSHMNINQVLELYTSACAITTDVRGLAAMAATYAFGGHNPVSGERLFDEALARDVLALMYNCGMYDYSGRFAFEVGIPAKSGVSGALFLSVPGKLGIAVYSPRVDRHGNSVRGLYVASQLVKALPELHVFSPSHLTTQVTEDVPSRAETEHLHLMLMQYVQHGDTDKVHELIECTGVDVNGTSPDGRTALHEAFASGRGDLAKFLLDHGADPTVTDNSGNTPLSEAERQGLQDFLRGNQAMGGNTQAGSLVTAHTHDSKETPTACDNEDRDTTDRS